MTRIVDVARVLAVVAVACLFAVGFAAGPAAAGDNVAIFDLELEETDAEPGETVTAEVSFSSHGGYGGEGVVELEGTLSYDADVLAVDDAEAGSFFESDGTDADVTIDDDENGTLSFEKVREPADEGTTGDEPVLTVTFAVADDAGPANADVELESHEAVLETDVPQATFDHSDDTTVAVAGGVDEPEAADDEEPEGVMLADDDTVDETADETDDSDGPGDEPATDDDPGSSEGDESAGATDESDAGEGADDSVPGFAALSAFVALVAFFVFSVAGRRH